MLRLFPDPGEQVPLHGLYLDARFGPPADRSGSFVYANFISSLDGRISLPDPATGRRRAPRSITNARDWRLFQELAAQADAVLVSGRYVRDLTHDVSAASFPVSDKPEYADLARWRGERGLSAQPAVVIVTATLDLPPLGALAAASRRVYVATGAAADARKVAAFEADGVPVLLAGAGTRVEGRKLIDALAREGHLNVALIGGGEMLNALLVDDALDRLYLTVACRVVGGESFDTLLTGGELDPPAGFTLTALHYDTDGFDGSAGQLFAILDRTGRDRGNR